MARKKDTIIKENESLVNDVVNELMPEDIQEVEAEKVEFEKATVKLKVAIKGGFTDKYTGESYKEDQEINVDKARAKELLSDNRCLVIAVK